MLEGPIPETVGLLPRLQYINLANNSLSSSIPESLFKLPKLGHLILVRCSMANLSVQDVDSPVPLKYAAVWSMLLHSAANDLLLVL